jgi:hypothetical protein
MSDIQAQLDEAKELLAAAMVLLEQISAAPIVTEHQDTQGNCSSCKYKGLPEAVHPCCECTWGGVIETDRLLWEEEAQDLERNYSNCRHEHVDVELHPCNVCDDPDDQWQPKASGPDVDVYSCSTCKHEDLDESDEPCNECYWGTEEEFSVNRWVAKED